MGDGKVLVTEVRFGVECKTRIWFSPRVEKEAERHLDEKFGVKLKRCCQNGFELFENVHPKIVRHEKDGVFRIGFEFSSFRIIGFYEDGTSKRDFICIDAFTKSGQKLGARERERIDRVVEIKRGGLWRKNDEYPKLA